MSSIEIVEFPEISGELVEQIKELREKVYAGDAHDCMPFEGTLERGLRRPEFFGRQRVFLARRTREVLACAVVRRSKSLKVDEGEVATVGQFEALEDQEAVSALLERACSWAIDEGAGLVAGPMEGDSWHRYRWNVGPFEERPFLKEPYNPSYYPDLWEGAGFEVWQEYSSLRLKDLEGARRHNQPRWARARALGYRLESMTKKTLERDLDRVYEIVRTSFEDAFLYTPISREEFQELYEGSEVLLDRDLCFFLVGPEGDDAAFSFVFPDLFEPVRAMGGSSGIRGKMRFLGRRIVGDGGKKRVNVKTVGVMPAHRRQGLLSAMSYKYLDAAIKKGFEEANLCLIMDGNPSRSIDAGLSEELRRYHLYRWAKNE